MRRTMLLLMTATFLVSRYCYALPPSNAESDAFMKTYSFDVLEALASESLAFKVESGQLSREQANCAKRTLSLDDLLPQARPLVAATFEDANPLNNATSFFSSPTGTKLKNFGIATLKTYLRAKLHGKQPPSSPAIPPDFTEQDARIAAEFNSSLAGQRFNRFVNEGLPKLKHNDQLTASIATCMSRGQR